MRGASIKYISRYLNVIILDNDKALLFNGVNGCLDEVPRWLADILAGADSAGLNSLDESTRLLLAKRGHITSLLPDEELARFREFCAALHKKMETNVVRGGIMFLLGYGCNLACRYCYQQDHRPSKSLATISPEAVEEVFVKHLEKIIPGVQYSNIDVSFYGGEPFLPSNEPTIRRILFYTKKFGMTSGAISNATMVDSMLDIFGPEPGHVNRVQISLDGSREAHDSSRVYASGEKTFDQILGNISSLIARKTKIHLRINLAEHTVPTLPDLIKELKSRKILGNPDVNLYATPLHDNIAKVDSVGFLGLTELSRKIHDLGIDMAHPISLRANEMSYLFQLEKGVGLAHASFCMQTMQNTLVLDPFGDLYACFEEAGYPEFRVGHVSSAGVEFFPLREVYRERHIANMKQCPECQVALACGGQCGVKSRSKTGDLFSPDCSGMRQLILESLKLAYLKRAEMTKGGDAPVSPGNSSHA